jgi:hypothetical protein
MNTNNLPWVCHICGNQFEGSRGSYCATCQQPVCNSCIGRIEQKAAGEIKITCKKCYSDGEINNKEY